MLAIMMLVLQAGLGQVALRPEPVETLEEFHQGAVGTAEVRGGDTIVEDTVMEYEEVEAGGGPPVEAGGEVAVGPPVVVNQEVAPGVVQPVVVQPVAPVGPIAPYEAPVQGFVPEEVYQPVYRAENGSLPVTTVKKEAKKVNPVWIVLGVLLGLLLLGLLLFFCFCRKKKVHEKDVLIHKHEDVEPGPAGPVVHDRVEEVVVKN